MNDEKCCSNEQQAKEETCCAEEPRGWTQDEEQAVLENKRWRQQLDAILQDIKGTMRVSRERSIFITKMQEAIMWAGMDLKALNDGRTIYPDSYDTSNTKVAPNADGLKM